MCRREPEAPGCPTIAFLPSGHRDNHTWTKEDGYQRYAEQQEAAFRAALGDKLYDFLERLAEPEERGGPEC
jgi:S-formylglutathione hydrolase FrmB